MLKFSLKSKGKEIRPYGIGSCPDPPHGLQLAIRFIESQPPFKSPYFLSTWIEYSEQVGEYLQVGGSRGEMKFWYPFMTSISGIVNIFFK